MSYVGNREKTRRKPKVLAMAFCVCGPENSAPILGFCKNLKLVQVLA